MTGRRASPVVESAAGGSGGLLIVGLAHSGKTEVRRIIDTSAGVFSARRARHWNAVGDRWLDLDQASCLSLVRGDDSFGSWGASVDAAIDAWRTLERPRIASLLALAYHMRASASRADLWCAQVNGIEPQIPVLLRELPGLKVIHTLRDPRTGLGVSRRSGMAGRRGWDLAGWEASARVAKYGGERFSDRYRVVRWEDLVSAPDEVVQGLGLFLDRDLEVPEEWAPDLKSIGGGITGDRTIGQVSDLLTDLGFPSRAPASSASGTLADLVDLAGFRLRPSVSDRIDRRGVDEW